MKCFACEKQDLKSVVVAANPVKLLTGKVIQFYDEEGRYHYHDTSEYLKKYKCSNGHEFEEKSYHGCPECADRWRLKTVPVNPIEGE